MSDGSSLAVKRNVYVHTRNERLSFTLKVLAEGALGLGGEAGCQGRGSEVKLMFRFSPKLEHCLQLRTPS